MIDKKRAFELSKAALAASSADQTEVVIIGEDFNLSRFAESRLATENLYRSETTLYVRAVKDKKIGITSTTDLREEGVRRAAEDACQITGLMSPDEQFQSLPSPESLDDKTTYYFDKTAKYTPTDRAEAVKLIVDKCKPHSLEASGAFETTTETLSVVNSLGVERFYRGTVAELSLTITGKAGNAGWATGYNRDVGRIDVAALADTAVDKAASSLDPIKLESGQYTVILEPPAVGQLLLFLGFMGFGGKTLIQRRSFMAGKIGEQIAGTNFTVSEQPTHPLIRGIPFDYEGIPRRQVPLIENGVAKGVVYNSYYANIAGTQSTGHALPPGNGFGPYPKHMVVDAGKSSRQEIIKSVERGVYITHFWYINFVNPMRTMITGTTRDGTFLIENGEVSRPIENMRMTQSILEAFSNIAMISRDQQLYPQFSVVMLVPMMKIEGFNLERLEA